MKSPKRGEVYRVGLDPTIGTDSVGHLDQSAQPLAAGIPLNRKAQQVDARRHPLPPNVESGGGDRRSQEIKGT